MVAALRPGGWLVLEDADPALQPKVEDARRRMKALARSEGS